MASVRAAHLHNCIHELFCLLPKSLIQEILGVAQGFVRGMQKLITCRQDAHLCRADCGLVALSVCATLPSHPALKSVRDSKTCGSDLWNLCCLDREQPSASSWPARTLPAYPRPPAPSLAVLPVA